MKFNVLITADCTSSTTVDVEADSIEDAERKALTEARDNPGGFNWNLDECGPLEIYVADPGNCAEIAPV